PDHILELNCGTGEDALYLARRGVHVMATDASEPMLHIARQKAQQAGLSDRIDVCRMTIEALTTAGWPDAPCLPRAFDGALSNFGGLNCVANLPRVAEGLAACLRPGAIAL